MNVEELLGSDGRNAGSRYGCALCPRQACVDVDRMRDIIDEVRNNLPDEIRESKRS